MIISKKIDFSRKNGKKQLDKDFQSNLQRVLKYKIYMDDNESLISKIFWFLFKIFFKQKKIFFSMMGLIWFFRRFFSWFRLGRLAPGVFSSALKKKRCENIGKKKYRIRADHMYHQKS